VLLWVDMLHLPTQSVGIAQWTAGSFIVLHICSTMVVIIYIAKEGLLSLEEYHGYTVYLLLSTLALTIASAGFLIYALRVHRNLSCLHNRDARRRMLCRLNVMLAVSTASCLLRSVMLILFATDYFGWSDIFHTNSLEWNLLASWIPHTGLFILILYVSRKPDGDAVTEAASHQQHNQTGLSTPFLDGNAHSPPITPQEMRKDTLRHNHLSLPFIIPQPVQHQEESQHLPTGSLSSSKIRHWDEEDVDT